MDLTPTTPYLIRAIHEWCVDNALTPHLLVQVNAETKVPVAHVKDGEIVLNLSYSATHNMQMENDFIAFSARFGGVSQNLYIPINAVKGIFARENGQGMFFEVVETAPITTVETQKPFEVVENDGEKPNKINDSEKKSKKPTLKVVK